MKERAIPGSNSEILSGKIYPLLIRIGLPVALATLLRMLYNLADTYWLGKLGRQALSAPVISFHILFFIISLAVGLTVAGTALVAQYTGAGKKDRADLVAGNLLTYLLVFSVSCVVLLIPLMPLLLKFLGTPGDTLQQASAYLAITLYGFPLAVPVYHYAAVMNALGDTRSPLRIEFLAVLFNLLLDPLLIFGWLGLPRLEVAGAALATVLTQALASALCLYLLFSGKKGIHLQSAHLKPDRDLLAPIMRIGGPAAVGMSGTSVGFLVLMGIVNSFGSVVIATYGIATRIIHIAMIPATGISAAVTTMVGQNLGAGNIRRSEQSTKSGLHLVLLFTLPQTLALVFSGAAVTRFFIPDDPLVHAASSTMYYFVGPSLIFFSLSTVITGAFQGSGHTMPVMTANLLRLWLIRIPLAYWLCYVVFRGLGDYHAGLGIWMAILASNFLAFLFIFLWYHLAGWQRKASMTDQLGKTVLQPNV